MQHLEGFEAGAVEASRRVRTRRGAEKRTGGGLERADVGVDDEAGHVPPPVGALAGRVAEEKCENGTRTLARHRRQLRVEQGDGIGGCPAAPDALRSRLPRPDVALLRNLPRGRVRRTGRKRDRLRPSPKPRACA
jgi:hypothetical protein